MAVRQIKGGLAGHPYTLLLSCLASLFLGGLLPSRARLRFGWRCKNNIISPQEQNPNRIISLILVHLITPSQKQPNFCPLHQKRCFSTFFISLIPRALAGQSPQRPNQICASILRLVLTHRNGLSCQYEQP